MDSNAIIDRIEAHIAVIEINGHTYDFPISILPTDAKEGDTIKMAITLAPQHRGEVAPERGSASEVIDL